MDERDTLGENGVSRTQFLRRTGALGIAGATALGFPLLETRVAGAAPLLPVPRIIAATGGATVKIGHIDGFSGVYASASESQQSGIELAVAEANKKGRIKYEIVKGDDQSKPAVGTTEAKRLISQEKVDVLLGCLSSGVGLAVSQLCADQNVFFLAIGTHDTNITGPKAHRVTFRQTTSNAMLANAIAPAMLKKGKKWYFITADYAFGIDAHDRLKKNLLAHGGQEVGEDRHPLGATDYSSYMTKARNTDADVLVFCNYGPDTQNATKIAVQLGLNKKMTFAGILCGNEVAVGMPVDDLEGSIWGYVWGGDAGGKHAKELYAKLKARAKGFPPNWRQYLGYIGARNTINRLEAVGSTQTDKLVAAFEDYHYDAEKTQTAYYRKCDHQAVQQAYAGVIVPKSKRPSAEEYFAIGNSVGGDFAAGPCSDPDNAAAEKAISSEKIGPREGYTAISLK